MHPEFDADLLRTFVAVVDTGSFTKASATVHRSQAAVSMQIKRLETMLGTTLFARNTRNLSLTRPGNTLLEYARRVLALHEEAWSAIVRPEVTGRVVLGAPDDYVSSLLSPVLRRFSNLYPHVEIEIVCAQSTSLAPMLADNKIDLAFVTRDRKLRGEFVRSEPMVWVGACVDTPVLAASPLPVGLYEPGCVARSIRWRARRRADSLSCGIQQREPDGPRCNGGRGVVGGCAHALQRAAAPRHSRRSTRPAEDRATGNRGGAQREIGPADLRLSGRADGSGSVATHSAARVDGRIVNWCSEVHAPGRSAKRIKT